MVNIFTGHRLCPLNYIQALNTILDPFLQNTDGTRAIIQTKYHRGEHKIKRSKSEKFWEVDGYAKSSNGEKAYEFQVNAIFLQRKYIV